jgi:hypothetical protein
MQLVIVLLDRLNMRYHRQPRKLYGQIGSIVSGFVKVVSLMKGYGRFLWVA